MDVFCLHPLFLIHCDITDISTQVIVGLDSLIVKTGVIENGCNNYMYLYNNQSLFQLFFGR